MIYLNSKKLQSGLFVTLVTILTPNLFLKKKIFYLCRIWFYFSSCNSCNVFRNSSCQSPSTRYGPVTQYATLGKMKYNYAITIPFNYLFPDFLWQIDFLLPTLPNHGSNFPTNRLNLFEKKRNLTQNWKNSLLMTYQSLLPVTGSFVWPVTGHSIKSASSKTKPNQAHLTGPYSCLTFTFLPFHIKMSYLCCSLCFLPLLKLPAHMRAGTCNCLDA